MFGAAAPAGLDGRENRMSRVGAGRTVAGMPIDIRPLATEDEEELHRFHEVCVRAQTQDGRDWTREPRYDELLQQIREPSQVERTEHHVALDDGRVVGAAVQWFWLTDNTDKSWLDVLVDPAERRRGVGSALVEYGVEQARRAGRTQVTGEATCHLAEREDGPVLRFARAHGFRMANMEICRKLVLPVDESLLDAIAADAAAYHGDYAVESFVHGVPDHLIDSFCALENRLAVEAPSGEFDWEEDSLTPEVLRDDLRKMTAVNRTRYTTVATRDGVVVALTDIIATKGEPMAFQWSTIVDRVHRGHRLGAAIKAANLRLVRQGHPEVTEIHTQNAETNAHMVGINERLGFVPVAVSPGFRRDL